MEPRWIMCLPLCCIVLLNPSGCSRIPERAPEPLPADASIDPADPGPRHTYDMPAYRKGGYWVTPPPHADRRLSEGRERRVRIP